MALTLDGVPYTVVGVMPEEFGYPATTTDVYVPMGVLAAELPWNDRGSAFGSRAVARLAEGVTLAGAQADMDRIGVELQEEFGNLVATGEVRSFADYYVGDVGKQIWILMGAVMAIIMLGFMWGMYKNRAANLGT